MVYLDISRHSPKMFRVFYSISVVRPVQPFKVSFGLSITSSLDESTFSANSENRQDVEELGSVSCVVCAHICKSVRWYQGSESPVGPRDIELA
ncbi:hypothetical protein AVEN_34681-1 [Araneus ventricosus]|uniref:Uncharacterized protein n=1 Tax=Araneus ventricosus TaxID=182803 RepID=A0A4Y2B0C4_ARAVE|nr:hypothetical protein AVEN_34681-1 [Araneus ventricosus]